MFTLIIGGSASGKSEYAERHVLSLDGPRIYIAAMEPWDEECLRRIEKHRKARAGRGFDTVECYRDIGNAKIPAGANVLLEDLGNLTANEMFSESGKEQGSGDGFPEGAGEGLAEGAGEGLAEGAGEGFSERPGEGFAEGTSEGIAEGAGEELSGRILAGIKRLAERCRHMTIVTNEVFSGGWSYGEETLDYLRALARINRELAAEADLVVEVVCGLPNVLRKEDAAGCSGRTSACRGTKDGQGI